MNFPHKGPVTQKIFPFDDVIVILIYFHVYDNDKNDDNDNDDYNDTNSNGENSNNNDNNKSNKATTIK